jgi:alpha-N-acetylglucosamine transferase
MKLQTALWVIVAFVLLSSLVMWFSVNSSNKRAVVTLITSNDDYVVGALALAASLKRVSLDTLPDLVCLVSPAVEQSVRDRLRSAGFRVRVVESIANPSNANPRFADTYSKLNAWRLTEYATVLWLDADSIVLKPIDALFRVNAPFAAVADCCDFFNSGVMVLHPSQAVFEDMMSKRDKLASYDGGDQGFLNSYFGKNWKRLDYIFNAQLPDYVDLPSAWHLPDICVMHFEKYKPWRPIASYAGKEDVLRKVFDIWHDAGGGDASELLR